MFLSSIFIGFMLVIVSLYLIRKEFNRAINIKSQMIEQSGFYNQADLFELLENMQVSIDEMNRAFYEIASDLEGKYSLHEKEIRDLQLSLEAMGKKYTAPANFTKPVALEPKPAVNQPKKEVDLKEQVLKMRSEGMSLAQIAKKLDMGYGELQLMLHIKK